MMPLSEKMNKLLIFITLVIFAVIIIMDVSIYSTVGRSMEPLIYEGNIVITAKGSYNIGDVIVFETPDNIKIIHRIYNIYDETYFTIGDNNPSPDNYETRHEDIIGKMVWVFEK